MAEPRYFWMLLSYDNEHPVFLRRKPHVFAAFRSLESGKVHEDFSVSWLPASGLFSLFRGPVKGKNHHWVETMEEAPADCLPVRIFGAQEITQAFFLRARDWKNELENGGYQYQVVDWLRDKVLNCSSALSHLKTEPFRIGLKAGHEVAEGLWLHYSSEFREERNQPELIFPELLHVRRARWQSVPLKETRRIP